MKLGGYQEDERLWGPGVLVTSVDVREHESGVRFSEVEMVWCLQVLGLRFPWPTSLSARCCLDNNFSFTGGTLGKFSLSEPTLPLL